MDEARALEAKNKRVHALVEASRRMAAGTDFTHPGFVAPTPRASRGIQRLLCSLGVLHVRASLLEEVPQLKLASMEDATTAVLRWDTGDAEGDLLEEWEEAYDRCRKCCQAKVLGHWPDREVPFTKAHVMEVFHHDSGWVGDIDYRHIKRQLLSEAT